MKTWWMKLLTAIGAGIAVTAWLALGFLSDYFMTGAASGVIKEAEMLLILWLMTTGSFYWMLHMGVIIPIRRNAVPDTSASFVRYPTALLILAVGWNGLQVHYENIDACMLLEQSTYLLKLGGLLALSLFVITDFKKWSSVCELHRQAFRRIAAGLKKPLSRIGRILSAGYRQLARGLGRIQDILYMLLTAVWSFLIVEIFCMHSFYELSAEKILWNLILYMILALLIWAPVRNVKWASIALLAFCALVGAVNYFVILFRGNPVSLGDISQAKTALSVAGGYRYTFNAWFLIAALLTAVGIVWSLRIRLPRRKLSVPNRLIVIGAVYLLTGIWILCVVKQGTLYEKIDSETWNPSIQSEKNGYLLNFLADTSRIVIQEPDGYEPDTLEELAQSYAEDGETVAAADMDALSDAGEEPNIIVIMNESFSDLSVLGELETDQEYLSYFHSLTEDTIYGTLYVSSFGGNTGNTEFEFLTGNTMCYIPTGMIPYISYVEGDNVPSLARILKEQETPYQTVAMHPYEKSGYNRVDVYESFGFDEFITIEDFPDYETDRKYVSDADDYAKLIELFEEKDDDTPLFVFNVTMQNHGGYGEAIYDMDEQVHALDYDAGTDLDEYLSCIRESDLAFETLIEYFEDVDEPTIILMFGDHQPQLSTAFYEMMYGKSVSELTQEDLLLEHDVPFVMWSNYQNLGGGVYGDFC